MRNNVFKLIFDTGKIFHIKGKCRGKAIEKYCKEYGVSKEWVSAHCVVKNLGLDAEVEGRGIID